jgi:hypothetical protein
MTAPAIVLHGLEGNTHVVLDLLLHIEQQATYPAFTVTLVLQSCIK